MAQRGESAQLMALRGAGLRATPQRLEIVGLLSDRTDHPTAEDLHRALRGRHPTLSLSTVYATLDSLERVGLCRRISLGDGHARYDGRTDRHAHLVCLRCRTVTDLPGGPEPVADAATDLGYTVAFTAVTHYGICPACQTRQADLD